MKTLSEETINTRLKEVDGWEYADNALQTAFEFDNFKEAFTMMTRIAFEAERLGHHPDWSNVYNRLHIALSTHDAGGVTDADFELAKLINNLLG